MWTGRRKRTGQGEGEGAGMCPHPRLRLDNTTEGPDRKGCGDFYVAPEPGLGGQEPSPHTIVPIGDVGVRRTWL